MSRPIPARKQKRALPPTPHIKAREPTTRAEALAIDFGRILAGIARSNVAYKPTRKDCDSKTEFYALAQRYRDNNVFSVANALTNDFRHIEQAVVLGLLDAPELLRRQLTLYGYEMVRTAIREAEPALAAELKKDEVARAAARTKLAAEKKFVQAQGDLFEGLDVCLCRIIDTFRQKVLHVI